jgi:hypothetical protein
MKNDAFQDHYPDELAHCYGCGRLNGRGHQLKSYWDGDETVASFTPEPYHIAIPGAAAAYREAGRPLDSDPPYRFVTASLHVDYLRPTPLGVPLEIRGSVEEVSGRKVVVAATVSAEGEVCAHGRVIAVQMPDHMVDGHQAS